ncbi:hypothetical protein GCM10025861_08680 [Methanobacterium petrolearium]|nr:hypothetical protein GCM10025861_08680 [Methanobacterium petrolearium]
MKEKMKEIGLRITELRKLSDLEVQDMADHLEISRETYQEYEEGKKTSPPVFYMKSLINCKWIWGYF